MLQLIVYLLHPYGASWRFLFYLKPRNLPFLFLFFEFPLMAQACGIASLRDFESRVCLVFSTSLQLLAGVTVWHRGSWLQNSLVFLTPMAVWLTESSDAILLIRASASLSHQSLNSYHKTFKGCTRRTNTQNQHYYSHGLEGFVGSLDMFLYSSIDSERLLQFQNWKFIKTIAWSEFYYGQNVMCWRFTAIDFFPESEKNVYTLIISYIKTQ